MVVEPEWGIDEYIEVCRDSFRQRSYLVESNVAIDPRIRWRPHLRATKGSDIRVIEVRITEDLPALWLAEMEKTKTFFPNLNVYIAIPSGTKILPAVLVDARRAGIGVYEIDGTHLVDRVNPAPATDTQIAEELKAKLPMFIIRRQRPYGNILDLRRILRGCRSYIHWLDRHFDRAGIERIYEEIVAAGLESIHDISIVCGLYENNITNVMRSDFKRFREECGHRGIQTAIRVVCDREMLQEVHDRFIITEGAVYSVLPVNAIEMGQFGQMFETEADPPFREFWDAGFDLVNDWERIEKELAALKKKSADKDKR